MKRNWELINIGQEASERISRIRLRQKAIAEAHRNNIGDKEVARLQRSLIESRDARVEAVKRTTVSSGGKTPGPDGEVWGTNKHKESAIEQLGSIINKPYQYRSGTRRSVVIPKPGSKEKRTLKIPNMIDRAAQHLYRMSTDPIVENSSDRGSFGYRRGRSAYEAIHVLNYRYGSKYSPPTMFFETDVSKCFDSIKHEFLRANVINTPGKPLLEQWLKAGVQGMDKSIPHDIGTPQGGVVSPIRCNVALNGLEKYIAGKGLMNTFNKRIERIRYADDIVVTIHHETDVNNIQTTIEEFRDVRGLNIKEAKTSYGNISEGLDFLGWNLRLRRWNRERETNVHGRPHLILIPSNKAIESAKEMIYEETSKEVGREERVASLNPRRIGWTRYFSYSYHSKKTIFDREHYLYDRITNWNRKKNPNQSRKERYSKQISGWTTKDGVKIFTPTGVSCQHPSFKSIVEWDKTRRIEFRNPYVNALAPRSI